MAVRQPLTWPVQERAGRHIPRTDPEQNIMGQRLAILSPEFIRNSDKFMGSYITDFKFQAGRIWHVKVAPMYERSFVASW